MEFDELSNFMIGCAIEVHRHLDCGYGIEILFVNQLIVELKRVEELKSIHEAQLLTNRKLAGVKIGLLMNFSVIKLKDGIKPIVLRFFFRVLRVLRGQMTGGNPRADRRARNDRMAGGWLDLTHLPAARNYFVFSVHGIWFDLASG